jgi:tetratricopeptide (TPR) repeat protein
MVWFVVAVLALVGFTPRAAAQSGDSPFDGQRVFSIQPTTQDKLIYARKMISRQDFQSAADLLEPLYEADPENAQVQNLLRVCYDQLHQYAKSELLIRRALEREPEAIGHWLSLAEVLAKLGKAEECREAYERCAELAEGVEDPTHVLLVIRSLTRSGMGETALQQIDRARRDYDDPLLFALERGGVLEKQRRYSEAADEYLPLLFQDTTAEATRAESRLLAMLGFEESAGEVEQRLRQLADSSNSLRTMRLMADHYLKAGRFDDAFAYTLRRDSLEGRTGYPLMDFVRRCAERKSWPLVVRMAEIILAQHPGSRFEVEASLLNAQGLAEMGRADEAIAVYTALGQSTERDQVRADALYGIGAVHLGYLGGVDSALHYFDSVASYHPRGQSYLLARRAIPRCLVRMGNLAAARSSLSDLQGLDLPEEMSEEIEFLAALVDFFDGRYDSAETGLRKLTVTHPRGFYVNDALTLLVAIGETGDDRPLLDNFAAARYLTFRGLADSAMARLYGVADSESGLLGDLALYQLIGMELDRADTVAALAAVERLSEEHPESYYRPLGLKTRADLLAVTESGWEAARELYRQLLEEFPEYPFVREIREKLRRMEPAAPIG